MITYTGYIYLWYDTKAKLFYIGGHKGKVEDRYICSSSMMLRAYKKRPETFKFKVLEYINGDNITLRESEQRWLDMIKDHELYWTPNIYNKTVKYYNKKKFSSGGNGNANKGKPHHWSWNRGLKGVQTYTLDRNKKISKSKIKNPMRTFKCPICLSHIETRLKTKKTCSNSCKNKLRHIKC